MAAPAWTRPELLRAWLLGTTALLPATGALTPAAAQGIAPNTLPTGLQTVAGAASVATAGSAMRVTQTTDRAAINAQSFNVGARASVTVQQPTTGAATLFRVTGADPSTIAGRLSTVLPGADARTGGMLALVNQSGIVFAAGAQVNVGSLIASAAGITTENFMRPPGGRLVFDGAPREGATVENHGSITIADRGLAALVGPRTANSGLIRARLGRVALAGAETFSIDLAGDGLLSIDVTQAVRTAAGGGAALVTNSGVIEAHGGSVLLTAHAASGLVEDLVRNTGSIAANAAAGRSGQVALRAEGGGVRVDGRISAAGRGRQSGGSIEVRGSTSTTIAGTATLNASGGAGGGSVLVGTTGVGRNQRMSAATTVDRGARIAADARRRGNGGTVAINSTGSTVVHGSVSARGGRKGGNGGLIELSGQDRLALQAQVDLAAPKGRAGTLLLDPQSITIVAALPGDPVVAGGAGSTAATPNGAITVSAATGGGTTFVSAGSLNALDAAGVTVQLEARQNIAVDAPISLANSTLNLFADGAVTQSAPIIAGTLVVRGFGGGGTAAGSATLGQANTIGTLDAIVTGTLFLANGASGITIRNARGSDVTLATIGAIDLLGPTGGSGASVVLRADGNIAQSVDGVVTAASLVVRDSGGGTATAGVVNLGIAVNSVASIDLATTSGLALVNDATPLTVAGLVAAAADLATSGPIAFTGPTTVTNSLRLATDGAVTQSGSGVVTAGTLFVTDRSNSGPTAAAVDLGALENAIGALDVRSTAAVAINNGGNALLLTRATGSGIVITAGALTVPGAAVVTTPGGTISLRVDSLAWGGLLDAGATGTLEIGPRSNAATVSLGAGGTGSLQIDPGSFDTTRLIAGTFTAGETTIGASTVRGNGLTVAGAVAPDAATVAAALRLVADAGTAISVEAPVGMAGRGLALVGSDSIGQTAAGRITAATLEIGAPGGGMAGAVTLDAAANALGRAAIASSGIVLLTNDATALTLGGLRGTGATITTGGTLTVDGAIGLGGGTLNLFSDGAISQTGGVVTAGSVVVRNAAGAAATTQAVALDGADNAIAAIDIASTGSVAVKNGAADLAVMALSASGATLTTGGALAFNGAADLGAGILALRAGGAVTQSGTAVITAGTLNTRDAMGGTSAAAVTLDTATNAIGALDGATSAAFALRTAPALTVAGLVAQSARLTSGAGISLAGAVTVTDGLALNATSFGASAMVTAGVLTLRGPDGIAAVAGSIDLGGMDHAIAALDAKGDGPLHVSNGTTDLLVNQAVGASVRLDGRGALSIAGLLESTGGTTLQVAGAVTSTAAASIRGPGLVVGGFAGGDAASIDLSSGTHALDSYTGRAAGLNRFLQGGDLVVAAVTGSTVHVESTSGAMALTGAVGGGGAAVTLAARGDLTQLGGTITAANLTASSATGAVDLQRANAVGSAGLSAGTALDFTAASALTVTGAAGTIVSLAAPSLSLNGAVSGTTRVQLTSSAGTIGQSGAGVVTTPDLRLAVTAGDATLTLANAVDQFRASAAGRAVSFTSARDLTLAGGISGTTVAVTGRSILVGAAQAPSVALDLTTTNGSITQTVGVALRADRMNFVAVGGDILLGSGDHAAAQAGFSAVGHAVTYNQAADPLIVTGASGAVVAITAPGMTLTGAVDATTSLALSATAGTITQTAAGAITTPRLTATALGGSVDLGVAADPGTGNAITRLGANASSGSIGVVSRTSMEIDAAGIGVTAAAGGSIALSAPGLTVNRAIGFGAANAANRITLTADALTATAAIDAGATGRVAIAPRAATRGIDIGGATTGTLQLSAATLGHVTAGRLLLGTAGATGLGLNADLTLAGVGTLELIAGTGITQDAATGITVAGLAATAAAGSIDLGGVNRIGAITGSLGDAATGLAASGGITLVTTTALAVNAKVVAGNGQTIAITASDLTTSARIATTGSSAGNRIDLRADTVSFGADVSAAGGQLNILPHTVSRAVRLGGADGIVAGALYLPTSQFRFVQLGDGLLRIGGTAAVTTAGTITLGGEVPLRASASGGGVVAGSAATVDLRGAAVATDPGVVFGLNVASLTGTTSGGFLLDQRGNAIDRLGAIGGDGVTVFSDLALTALGPIEAGAGRVVLGSAGQLTLAGDIHGATGVALRADAAILQTGGRITGDAVEVGGFIGQATGVTFLQPDNDFARLSGSSAGAVQAFSGAATTGTLTLSGLAGTSVTATSARDLGIGAGGIAATAGALALEGSGTITLGGSLAATGNITLLANAAAGISAITQTAGTVQSGATSTIGLTADSITLLAAANSIRTGAAGTAGLVRLRSLTDGRAITLGGTVANTLSIASGAGISAGRVLIGNAGAGSVTVAGQFGVGAATLELITGGAITQAGGTVLTAGGLSATAGGAITLDGQNLIDAVAGSTADPSMGLTSGGGIALTTASAGGLATGAAIAAADGASITLRADALALGATVGASSGSLAALNILPNTLGTAMTLGADAAGLALNGTEIGFLRAGTGTLRIGGDGSSGRAGTITLAGDLRLRGGSASAAVLDLRGGSVVQTGGGVAVATVTGATTAGGFVLDLVNRIDSIGLAGAGNTVAVSAAGGPVAIASSDALTVRGNVTATAAAGSGSAGVSLRGDGLAIGDDTAVAKTVLVQAGRGDVVLQSGNGRLTTSAVTTLRVQDPASLAAEGKVNDGFGNILLSGRTVTLAGTLDAGRASGGRDIGITATDALDTGGAVLTARRNIGLASTAGGITVRNNAILTAGRDITLGGLGAVQVDGTVTANRSIGVASTGSTVGLAGVVTGAAIGPALAEAGAGITVNGFDGVSLDGSLTATGRSIRATAVGGTLSVTGTLSTAAGGGITLDATGTEGRVLVAAAGSLDGGTVTVDAARRLQILGSIGGTDIALTVGPGAAPLSSAFEAGSGSSIIASGSLGITANGGNIDLTSATLRAGTTLGLTAAAGDLTQTGGSITAGTTLTLTSAGDTTQQAGGRIIAPVLTGTAGGSVSLINGVTLPGALVAKASGNSIAAIGSYIAGGDLTLASNVAPLRITGLVSAGSGRALRLFADDLALTAGLAAPGGSVTLSPYTRDGSIALVLGGSGGSAAGTITLDSAEITLLPLGGIGSLRFGRTDNPSGLTDIASVTIAGAVDLGTGAGTRAGKLELNTRGAITQMAGTSLIVPLLAATAGGSIGLDPGSPGNRIGGLAGIQTPGNFSLRTSLVDGAAMTIGAGSGTAGEAGASGLGDAILVGSGQAITLRADDLDIGAAVRAPSGSITLLADTAGRGITLGGSGAGTLSLSAAELLLLGGERGANLTSGAANLLRIDATTVPGAIAIAGAVDLQGPTARFQALELLSAGNVAGSGGAITVPVLRAAVAGDLVLDNAGNTFLLNRITAANATIAQAGDLQLANAVASLGGVDAPGGIAAGGTVRLIAGGTITQDSGATIAAGALALSAGQTVTLDDANAFVTLADVSILGGGASSLRAANFTVAGPVTVTGGLRLLGDTGLGATGSIGTSGALALATTLGDIVLGGATLTAGAGLAMTAGSGASSGGDIRVTGGSIGVTGAAVLTATRDGTSANPGDISVSGTLVTASTALTLTAGGGIAGVGSTLAATAGAFAATAASGGIGFSGTTAAGGTTTTLAAASGLTVTGGGLAANGGALLATTATGDLALDSASVTATGLLGLTATAGAITQRRGVTSGGGAVTLQAFSGLGVTADGGASPVLRSTGGSLAISTSRGHIGFTDATVAAAGTLTVTTASNSFGIGALAVTGGTMTAGGALRLDATDTITQTGGSIFGAGAVTLLAQNAVLIQQAGSPTAAVLRSTGSDLSVTSAFGDIRLRSVDIAASGTLQITSTAGAIAMTEASASNGGALALAAATGLSATASTLSAGGSLAAISAGGVLALDISTVTAGGSLALQATAGAVTQRRGITSGGGDVTLLAGTGITLTNDGGTAPVLRSTGADLRLATTAGDILLAGASLAAGNGLAMTAGTDAGLGGLVINGGNLVAGTTLALLAGNGAVALSGSGLVAGRDVRITAGTGLALDNATLGSQGSFTATTRLGDARITDTSLAAGGTLSITAMAGAVTQTRGSIIGGGDTRLQGGAAVTLTDGGSGTGPSLRSAGGALTLLADAGDVALRNASIAAADRIGLIAGQGVSIAESSLTATGTLGIAAIAGDLTILRSALGSLAGDLDLTAGGAGSITASSLGAPSPAGRVRVVTGDALTLRSLGVTADAADFEAGRIFPGDQARYGLTRPGAVLTTGGIVASIGTKLLFAGPGGITDLGLTLVMPRSIALPAVLYDTRRNPAVNPLTQVLPDTPGLVASAQPTQVRGAAGAQSSGAFGLPDQNSPAGNVAINVDAGQSAVFLLVDGGDIQGNITAGRLGVHGSGGTMTILGLLGGSQGAEAARFADITRPIAAEALQRYRINGCVIGSVNCVVPPSIQIIPPRPADRAAFTLENNRINTFEVLIPNIAEEDDDE